MPTIPSATQKAADRRSERGFTLVELMVALTGGLFLSSVVFVLARDSTRFFQREARLASSTLSGIVGFERLKADIERAGYLSTPNIQRDPAVLTRVDTGSPEALRTLAGVRITPDTPDLSGNSAFALNAAAGQTLTPDQLVLSGSYNATDEFPISDASTGSTIFLQVNTVSMSRLGYLSAGSSAAQLVILQNVFGANAGQILRVRDQTGRLYFGQITNVTAGTQPSITVNPPLPIRTSSAFVGGLRGFEMGSSANVVNIVRYRIAQLVSDTSSPWQPLFVASAGAPGESSRTELVRDQLNAAGNAITGTTDIVAEYAVDLGLSVLGQLSAGVPGLVLASSGPTFQTFFQPNATGDRPQGVRSVRVRLSVRSREADRSSIISGGFFRFQVTSDAWARVRTFQADVALPNQASVQW